MTLRSLFGARILVVDDDPDLLELLALTLEPYGCQVEVAGDGAKGLERVEQAMPDLIALDLRMPVMNGWDFAATFRARYDRAAPIVVLTAAEDAGRLAREVAAEGVLSKPFDIADLVRAIDEALTLHHGGGRAVE